MNTYITQYCGINMTDRMIAKLKRFQSVHIQRCSGGNGLLEFIIRPDGIGATVKVRCIRCGTTRDITDSDLW